MDFLTDWINEWIKGLLVDGIMGNLSGLFENVNDQIGEIATQVGTTPGNWNPGVFSLIRQLSETVVLPIAGLVLTFVMCYELIQMLIDRNNLHEGVCCKRCISNASNTTRTTVGTFMVKWLKLLRKRKSGDMLRN